jgi:two-component system LytT family response regulator
MMAERKGLTVLIIEDEYDAMTYCASLIQEIERSARIYKAGSGNQGLRMLANYDIDAVFIDVRLPDINGFNVAAKIREIEHYRFLPIVFVTAEKVKQLEVYKTYHCYEYIMKPFAKTDFLDKISPLLSGIVQQKASGEKNVSLAEKLVIVESGSDTIVIKFNDILFAEIAGRTLNLYTRTDSHQNIRMKLDELIAFIGDLKFQKCHKSYAVNINNIGKVCGRSQRSWDIHFKQDEQHICPMSNTFYKQVMDILKGMGD